jgi:transcriptional regulator with XRE-family HTH domain
MTPRNIVGPQIRRYRGERDLTQEDFVARCGVQGWHLSRGTLAKIEAQVRCVTDAELAILARALRRPIEQLYPADRAEIIAQLNQADQT